MSGAALVLSVASSLIAAVAALTAAWLAYQAQSAGRNLTGELKIADLRAVWLGELREALSELIAQIIVASGREQPPSDRMVEIERLAAKVVLLSKPNETKYIDLCNAIDAAIKKLRTGEAVDVTRLTTLGQQILQDGWRGLKRDLPRWKGAAP